MNYWFLCLPRADMEHCIKVGTFGLNRKFILGQIAEEDKIVCCAGKGDWKIIALGTASSGYYVDDEKIFLSEGLFPDRFRFRASKLSSNEEVDVMALIDRLSFVTNLAYWAVYFRGGIVKISKQDWDMISNAAKCERA